MSTNSEIIIVAETIRQRLKRTLPHDIADDELDYKSRVHTFSHEKLSALFKSKITVKGRCTGEEACGLNVRQATEYFKAVGPNKMTPPVKRNPWIVLLEACFLGVFNILLWACVVAEVALIVIFSGKSVDQQAEVGTLINPNMTGPVEGAEAEVKGEEEQDYVTPIILSVVIIMAGMLRWYSEMKAESQMDAMTKMQEAKGVKCVRRGENGQRIEEELDSENLVPGDIIFLKAGDKVPADIRILWCSDGMEVDNSALTGESVPEPRVYTTEKECPPTEGRNLAFFGTSVLKGDATCLVHATGDNTFLGKINQGIKQASGSSRQVSTLEIQIDDFVHKIAVVAVAVGLLSLVANLMSPVKRSSSDILQNCAAALFAQVPEGLLPTVTISLMIASDQMYHRNVIVRKIDAVETLGCINVFCSDKTGTLTTGEMTVQDFVVPNSTADDIDSKGLKVVVRDEHGKWVRKDVSHDNVQTLASAGILNNAATIKGSAEPSDVRASAVGGSREWQETWKAEGSPTEVAILRSSVDVAGGPHKMQQLKLDQFEHWS